MTTIRLLNPRGRVVIIEDKQVPELLKKGFVYPPEDQPNIQYSQVYDKGAEFQQEIIKEKPKVVPIIERLGDTLQAELI